MATCWKCKGTGLQPVKLKQFAGAKCKVCSNPPKKKQRLHKPYRPFKHPISIGPKAKYDMYDPTVAPEEDEMLTSLCGSYCIYQQENGHRMTSDDVCVAAIALSHSQKVKTYLDLGTGLGAVLNIVNWKRFGEIECCFGVEAQVVNFELAKKTIKFNGIDGYTSLVNIDMRELLRKDPSNSAHVESKIEADNDDGVLSKLESLRVQFDLITGTPPYFQLNQKSIPIDKSREMCAFETRGGIEIYLQVAKEYLSPSGLLVLANGFRELKRSLKSAHGIGFECSVQWNIHGKQDKEPLFNVFCFHLRKDADSTVEWSDEMLNHHRIERLDIRGEDCQYTREYQDLMVEIGKPRGSFEIETIPPQLRPSTHS